MLSYDSCDFPLTTTTTSHFRVSDVTQQMQFKTRHVLKIKFYSLVVFMSSFLYRLIFTILGSFPLQPENQIHFLVYKGTYEGVHENTLIKD